MTAYQRPFEPVALPGQLVEFRPRGTVFEIESFEQLADIGDTNGVHDFGAATSGSNATESGEGNTIPLDEMEMNNVEFAQIRVFPISPVDIQVAQTGNEDTRFRSASRRGRITPSTPTNQTELFVQDQGEFIFTVTNNMAHDLDKTLVRFSGFKYVLGDEVQGEPRSQPTVVPVSALEVS